MTPNSYSKILILGAGWVGRQVAARIAKHRQQVLLVDQDPSVSQDALRWIQQQAAKDTSHNDWDEHVTIGRALAEWDPTDASQIDLVIECVPEQLSVKRRALVAASKLFPTKTSIVSNSSYFVPSLFASYLEAPERYAHLHFHVPVLRDSVVDIAGHEGTDPRMLVQLQAFSESLGLQAIVLKKEHPGYVFNWMLQALLQSALELVALDVVDIAEVDRSWRSVTGMPLGPFEMMDQIGLDVVEQVLANSRWAESIDAQPEQLLELLREKTKQGQLGRKTLQGFYAYDDDTALH